MNYSPNLHQESIKKDHFIKKDINSNLEHKKNYTQKSRRIPLENMYTRGHITRTQYEAGARLRRLFEKSTARVSRMLFKEPLPQPGRYRKNDQIYIERIEAWRRVQKALDSQNTRGRYLLLSLLCEEKNFQTIQRETGWQQKYISERFRETLDDLSVFYGLKNKPTL